MTRWPPTPHPPTSRSSPGLRPCRVRRIAVLGADVGAVREFQPLTGVRRILEVGAEDGHTAVSRRQPIPKLVLAAYVAKPKGAATKAVVVIQSSSLTAPKFGIKIREIRPGSFSSKGAL